MRPAAPGGGKFYPDFVALGGKSANCKDLATIGEARMNARALIIADDDVVTGILDEDHLARMTLGDRRLEREVLEIFLRQIDIVVELLAHADADEAAMAAHTMKGSARGIGAWLLASAAERLEQAAGPGSRTDLGAAIDDLKAASLQAKAMIGARLNGPQDLVANA